MTINSDIEESSEDEIVDSIECSNNSLNVPYEQTSTGPLGDELNLKRARKLKDTVYPNSVMEIPPGIHWLSPPVYSNVMSPQYELPPPILPAQQTEANQHQQMGTSILQVPNGRVNAEPNSRTKEWHQLYTTELRNDIVHKLVQSLLPITDTTAVDELNADGEVMQNLAAIARRVESVAYKTANTRSEYYHLIGEKIYKVQRKLTEEQKQL